MASSTNFFDQFERYLRLSMNTFAPARVVSFDEEKRTADVELLFLMVDLDGDLDKYPLIEDVPVAGMRYRSAKSYKALVDGVESTINPIEEIEFTPFLKKDDVVWVAFAQRSLDNMKGNKPFNPEFYRTHDIKDAVVLGVSW